MSFLQLRNVHKQFGQQSVLSDLSLEVKQGEFLAILGPSGCGKSTCLKIIAGLEQPSSGDILIQTNNVTAFEPQQRGLSMVFQSYALLPHLTVKENILFGLKARKISKNEQATRLASALDMVDLAPQLNKKPAELSGGQCQRVALARAIVSQAPLCLMDEPLSNLDAKLRASMRQEIRSLQKKLGLTLVYVTHDQIEAMSMADNIALLNAGKLEQIGAPYELYNRPATPFVANFIGQPGMNLCTDNDTVFGVRPEHICIAKHGYKARVITCDYQGVDTLLRVDFNGADWQVPVSGHQPVAIGSTVCLRWSPEHMHYFSLSSHTRIDAGDDGYSRATTQTQHVLTQLKMENTHD